METADNINLDELPLSSSIQQKLSNWAEIYSRIITADSYFSVFYSKDVTFLLTEVDIFVNCSIDSRAESGCVTLCASHPTTD
jgi:hypothetical protein